MGKFIDLTGQKFNHWTVLERGKDYVSPGGIVQTRWVCQCDCENKTIKELSGASLRKGTSKSCGCYAIEMLKISDTTHKVNEYDLTGDIGVGYTYQDKIFLFDKEDYDKIKDICWCSKTKAGTIVGRHNGKLVRLHRFITDAKEDEDVAHINHKAWDNRKENLDVIKAHDTKRNSQAFVDLTGMTFGRLTVVERVESDENGNARWLCKCSCGNYIKVIKETGYLRHSKCPSCGCYVREIMLENGKKNGGINKGYNTFDLSGEYGIGYTRSGQEYFFDLEDYDKIKDICWSVNGNGYLERNVLMHRLIMNTPDDMVVDHINHNTLDNRKENLRNVTKQQNGWNKKIYSNNTTGFTGVYRKGNKFEALIMCDGITYRLGTYYNIEDAAKAREQATIEFFGEYAYKPVDISD